MSDTDLLRLAQLQKSTNLSKEQKLDLVKEINVHYGIPNESHQIVQKQSYYGYNCLHFAALNLDGDMVCEFLGQGADPFKQGTQDYKTPLHVAVDSIKNSGRNKIWKISGKLQSCQVVNILLSAHMTSGNSLNPICKNGISHLHIACMFNCKDVIEFLLKNGRFVNQVTNFDAHWPGYTPLHFATRYSCVEAAQCLMNNGADMLLKDAEGTSALSLLIDRLLKEYNSLYGSLTMEPKCKEEISAIEAIITIFKGNKSTNDILHDTGLTTFHIVCTFRDTSIAAQFLKHNIDLNVAVQVHFKFWPGWTPLHFAACSNAETVELLIQNGADITLKNAEGKTPLDMCLKNFSPSVVHSILSTKDEYKSILLTDESTTLLDLLLAMDNRESFGSFLEMLENPNVYVPFTSPILSDYNILHLAVSMSERIIMQDDLVEESDSEKSIESSPGYDYGNDEFYDQRDLTLIIEPCLERGCSVTMVNFDRLTPIHLAFRNHCLPCTIDKLLASCEQDAVDPDNLSLLHIACATGDPEVVRKLIRAGADVNIATKKSFQWYQVPTSTKKPFLYPIHAKSTPLHVAVTFANSFVVESLLDNGADVCALDAEGFTPIHLSIVHSSLYNDIAHVLFNRPQSFVDRTSPQGLSHLHVAAFASTSKTAVKTLILNGANVNGCVATRVPELLKRFAGKTPLELAMQNCYGPYAVETLIENGANVYAGSVLQFLMANVYRRCTQFLIERLKLRGNAREPVDPSGLTLLHVSCGCLDLVWTKELLEKGVDVNARIRDDENYKGPYKGYTPLHVLVSRLKAVTDDVAVKMKRLVRLLVKHGADVTIDSCDGTALHIVYRWALKDDWEPLGYSEDSSNSDSEYSDDGYDEIRMRRDTGRTGYSSIMFMLLKSQRTYQINPIDSNGFSHFHLAGKRFAIEIIEKFLNSGVDVNHSTSPFSEENAAYTALHFVINSGDFSFKTISFLIERGANLYAEDRDGNTPLHLAVSKKIIFRQEVLGCFKKYGANFNAKNVKGETPADVLLTLTNFTLGELQCLLSSGSSINLRRSGPIPGAATLIMRNAKPTDRLEIFKTFIKVCNIEAATKNGYNPIQDVALARYDKFFLEADDYLDVIQLLVNEGCDVDQRDECGNTPLCTSSSFVNTPAVEALLRAGADVNNVGGQILKMISGPLVLQLYKMKSLGLHVKATSNEIYNEFERTSKIGADVEESCKREMEKANSFIIANSVTAKVFLSESEAVFEYWKMPPDQRQDIDVFFKRLTYLNKEFPQLGGLMVLQYKKAIARSKLVKAAQEVLPMDMDFDVDLPDAYSGKKMDEFSNDDLKCVIAHFEEVSQPRKRQKIE